MIKQNSTYHKHINKIDLPQQLSLIIKAQINHKHASSNSRGKPLVSLTLRDQPQDSKTTTILQLTGYSIYT